MRQILMILTAMLLTCCSSDSEIKAERLRVGDQGSGMTNQVQANMAKTLIAYYSYTGNCKAIVNSLASQITTDQFEIQSYPAIDPVTVNLDDYQNIIYEYFCAQI